MHVDGSLTRAELTRHLGLNRSTVGGLTSELESLGLVVEKSSVVRGRSGRPSHLVVPQVGNAVVAVDIQVDRVEVAVVGLGGAVLARRSRSHQRGSHEAERLVSVIADLAREVVTEASPDRWLGVGVAVPGVVREGGIVEFAPNLGWVHQPFATLLAERLGRPVQLANDANLGILAEHVRGAAAGHRDAAYLAASVGIGGGFLIDGRLLQGSAGYAGEIGHIQVDPAGLRCRCGAVGCWETAAGENRLLSLAGRSPGGGAEAVAEVMRAAAEGEAQARSAVDAVTGACGAGLRAIVNLFNPEIIVLGGSLEQLWRHASAEVEQSFRSQPSIAPAEAVRLAPAGLGRDSSLVGAAELAFEEILADPQKVLTG
ncbi:MAG TPA: ROK family protein [Nocardioides sp.]|nr:ROK family protein [Nocardioides sp.]